MIARITDSNLLFNLTLLHKVGAFLWRAIIHPWFDSFHDVLLEGLAGGFDFTGREGTAIHLLSWLARYDRMVDHERV